MMGVHQDRFREAEQQMLEAQQFLNGAEADMWLAIGMFREAEQGVIQRRKVVEELREAAILEAISERLSAAHRSKQRI